MNELLLLVFHQHFGSFFSTHLPWPRLSAVLLPRRSAIVVMSTAAQTASSMAAPLLLLLLPFPAHVGDACGLRAFCPGPAVPEIYIATREIPRGEGQAADGITGQSSPRAGSHTRERRV